MNCRCYLGDEHYCGFESYNNHPIKFHCQPHWFKGIWGLNREYYHVTDLDLWFESDMEEGVILLKYRVSKHGKYNFKNNNRGKKKMDLKNKKIGVMKFEFLTLGLLLILFGLSIILRAYYPNVLIMELIHVLFCVVFGVTLGVAIAGRGCIEYDE